MKGSKHIGIVACSYEGAALCYRSIAAGAEETFGQWNHPRITIDSIPLAEYLSAFNTEDYGRLAEIISKSVSVLANAGADFAICPDNSCHVALPFLSNLPIPFLSILDVVADEAQRLGLKRVAILGTRFTMGSDMYPRAFANRGIKSALPPSEAQTLIDRVIFEELVKGIFTDASRGRFGAIIAQLRSSGCDGAALVCTEIPLLISSYESFPLLNSTELLAKAAILKSTS